MFLCSDACFLTLDPNTANTRLILSEENRKVTHVEKNQSYPDHPERFDEESLLGRCYWEAEWSGCGVISVTYKGISRKESHDCQFEYSEKSWSLEVGVYVDVSSGTLSFYSVSNPHKLTHLHTFSSTFTEPVYAGFGVYGSSMS
ncbi:hypothetical protein M9458_055059, partial [Cirrhinus mrigala]